MYRAANTSLIWLFFSDCMVSTVVGHASSRCSFTASRSHDVPCSLLWNVITYFAPNCRHISMHTMENEQMYAQYWVCIRETYLSDSFLMTSSGHVNSKTTNTKIVVVVHRRSNMSCRGVNNILFDGLWSHIKIVDRCEIRIRFSVEYVYNWRWTMQSLLVHTIISAVSDFVSWDIHVFQVNTSANFLRILNFDIYDSNSTQASEHNHFCNIVDKSVSQLRLM